MRYDEAIERLDDQQLDAVLETAKTTVIEAVPGSGKTTTITAKVAYLIREVGIDPSHIAMMTFTTTATKDMRYRLDETFDDIDTSQVTVRTIHSFANSVATEYRIRHHMSMLEVADSSHVRQKIRELGKDGALGKDKSYLTDEEISDVESCARYYKNLGAAPGKFTQERRMFDLYQKAKSSLGDNVLDFDDMVVYASKASHDDPGALDAVCGKFEWWLIDEAQDCSPTQHELISLMTKGKNVIFVGDVDQSIYGFMAARPKLLAEIAERPETKVVRIESNYRSDAHICRVADMFLTRPTDAKHIRPKMGEGGRVRVRKRRSTKSQTQDVINFIKEAKGDVAILYRNNISAIPLVHELDKRLIDFAIRSPKLNFFTSRIVQDARAALRLAQDPSDKKAFLRMYSRLSLFASRKQAEKAISMARTGDNLIHMLALTLEADGMRLRALEFAHDLALMRNMRPADALEHLADTAYKSYLKQNGGGKNLRVLIELVRDAPDLAAFEGLLEATKISMEHHGTKTSNVTLSTVHSAKGLEWDNVCIIDVNDRNMPAAGKDRPNMETADIEREERNIMYVALTRARHDVLVLSSSNRPSEFMGQIEEADEIAKDIDQSVALQNKDSSF